MSNTPRKRRKENSVPAATSDVKAAPRIRIDVLLVEQGLAPSRERAQRLIMADCVRINDRRVTKPGELVRPDGRIQILKQKEHDWVSRGALKLLRALDDFRIEILDRVAVDVGASTGGFTHVLLEKGCKQVFALDVGHNQLDYRIRSDSRVVPLEGVNVRNLQGSDFPVAPPPFDIVVMDVSFISVTKVIPAVIPFTHSETDWVILIKPQFEVGKGKVGKGGIVRDESEHQRVLNSIELELQTLGLRTKGLVKSPIKGTKGNVEFLVHLKCEKLN